MEAWKARVYETYTESATGGREDPAERESLWSLERRQYIQRYRRFLPRDKTVEILDVGCGSGTLVGTLRSLGYTRVEGVDASPAQVATARARGVADVTLGTAVQYLNARSNRYALITVLSVLEHQTRAELFDLLDAIRGALIPGGMVIALVPNAKGLFGAHVRFADITHELSFTPTSVRQICGVASLECVAIQENGPLVHGPSSGVRWLVWQMIRGALLVARLAEGGDWRYPVFTQDLVFIARKPA